MDLFESVPLCPEKKSSTNISHVLVEGDQIMVTDVARYHLLNQKSSELMFNLI
jgi:hypothetical protein